MDLMTCSGLEYLTLVPRQHRSYVVERCGRSPVIGQLRQVMYRCIPLAATAADVEFSSFCTLVVNTDPMAYWGEYWQSLLKAEFQDTDLFKNELLRRMGPLHLVGAAYDADLSRLCDGSGVSSAFGHSGDFPVAEVRRLAFEAGGGLGVLARQACFGSRLTADGELENYADVIIGDNSVFSIAPSVVSPSESGYCYLSLFDQRAAGFLSTALGPFPKSTSVALYYMAASIRGISLSGKSQVIRPAGFSDARLHVQPGCMSTREVFLALSQHDVVVGASTSAEVVVEEDSTPLLEIFDFKDFFDLEMRFPDDVTVVAMNPYSYQQFRAWFDTHRISSHLFTYDQTLEVDCDELWLVDLTPYTRVLSDEGRSLVSKCYSRAKKKFVYGCASLVQRRFTDEFLISVRAGRSLHPDFHQVKFEKPDGFFDCIVDPIEACQSLLCDHAAAVLRSPARSCRASTAVLEFCGVLLFELDEVAADASTLAVYKVVFSFAQPVAVLVPPQFAVRVEGVTLDAVGSQTCFVADSASKFSLVAHHSDITSLLLPCASLKDTDPFWQTSGFYLNGGSSEVGFASTGLHLMAPVFEGSYGCVVDAFEVSEPFDRFKPTLSLRVVTIERKFRVNHSSISGDCKISGFRCEDHNVNAVLVIGPVRLTEGSTSVYLDSAYLNTCQVTGFDMASESGISFNIDFLWDDSYFEEDVTGRLCGTQNDH